VARATERRRARIEAYGRSLRAAEAALAAERDRAQTYFDIAGVVMLVLGPDGVVQRINHMGEELLGEQSATVTGRVWFDRFVAEEDRQEARAAFAAVLRGDREPSKAHESRLPAGRGRRLIAWRYSLLRDGSGRVIGALACGEDVTERRGLEESRHLARKMEAVGTLAGGVAHNFNNLLQVIRVCAGFTLDSFEPGDLRRADLQKVLDAGQRGDRLVQGLLALTDKRFPRSEVLDASEVLREAAGTFESTLPAGVLLTVKAPQGLAAEVNRGELEHALMSLLANAREAVGEAGGIAITARREVATGPGRRDEIVIEVDDDGDGMSAEIAARAFEPFFTTKQRTSGTGLGLALVYGMVKAAGGSVEVDSTPGLGSCFSIRLPAVGAADAPAAREGSSENGARSGPAGAVILLAEDEPSVRELVSRLLEMHGYGVMAAASPGEALQALDDAGRVDLLLTDVVMPGGSGVELAEAVARARPDVRVVFMSGYPEDILRDNPHFPNTRLVPKPFAPEDLVASVREALSEPALH
jgi:PAS domain S-box-containing protein